MMIAKLNIFLCFVLPFVAAGAVIPVDDCTEPMTPNQLAGITLSVYLGPTANPITGLLEYPLSLLSLLDLTKPIVLIVTLPGQATTSSYVQPLLDVYLGCDLFNILLIDYGTMTVDKTTTSSGNLGLLGQIVAGLLNGLVALGLDLSLLRIAGAPSALELILAIEANVNLGTSPGITILGLGLGGTETVCQDNEQYQTSLTLNALNLLTVNLDITA